MRFKLLEVNQLFKLVNDSNDTVYQKTRQFPASCCTEAYNGIEPKNGTKNVIQVEEDEEVILVFKPRSPYNTKMANQKFGRKTKETIKKRGIDMLLSNIPSDSIFVCMGKVYKFDEDGQNGGGYFAVINLETGKPGKLIGSSVVTLKEPEPGPEPIEDIEVVDDMDWISLNDEETTYSYIDENINMDIFEGEDDE